MTFILALNLTDRIYLAADTLVSKNIENKKQPSGIICALYF